MFLFFDTETTGLPANWRAPPTDTENWPRIVQLAWILADAQGALIEEKNFLIKPDGFCIPEESTAIHGITTEHARKQGTPLVEALEAFFDAHERSHALVAHNISFDSAVLAAECVRADKPLTWLQDEQVCTMKQATDYCQLPGRYGHRWPKLIELHEILFEKPFSGAHDALADVQACAKCFYELHALGVLKTQKL